MAALSYLLNNYFRHQTAEVLGVVRQVVKVRRVEEISARGNIGAVENRIQRLPAPQGDRVGFDIEVVPRLIPQQLGVKAHQFHGNPKRRQSLVLGDVQVRNSEQGSLTRATGPPVAIESDQGMQRLRKACSAIGVLGPDCTRAWIGVGTVAAGTTAARGIAIAGYSDCVGIAAAI